MGHFLRHQRTCAARALQLDPLWIKLWDVLPVCICMYVLSAHTYTLMQYIMKSWIQWNRVIGLPVFLFNKVHTLKGVWRWYSSLFIGHALKIRMFSSTQPAITSCCTNVCSFLPNQMPTWSMYSVVEQSWCVRGFQGGWYVGKALYKMTSKIVGLFHMYFLQPVIVLPLPLFFFFLIFWQ